MDIFAVYSTLILCDIFYYFIFSLYRERKPSDYKFFCEDIEPVSLIWTKVDEAMLTSSSSAESSFDQDFDDFANDDIKTEVMNLTWHNLT